MILSQLMCRTTVCILWLLFCDQVSAERLSSQKLPSDSVYNLSAPLENQAGALVGLDEYSGHPVVVSMFYASCPHVCPMLISTIRFTEEQLPEDLRSDLRVLLISVDPDRDTPDVLQETFARYKVDATRWSMARPEAGDVRAIAGVFGIKYKQLPDGEFSHSTKLILLDRNGVQIASSEKLGSYDTVFLEALKAAIVTK